MLPRSTHCARAHCTRPTQDWICQHFITDVGEAYEALPIPQGLEQLMVTGGAVPVSSVMQPLVSCS